MIPLQQQEQESLSLFSFTQQVVATKESLQNKSYEEGSIERVFAHGLAALEENPKAVEEGLFSLANRCTSTRHQDLCERVTLFIQSNPLLKNAKVDGFLDAIIHQKRIMKSVK